MSDSDFRVVGSPDDYGVSELTESAGLVPVLRGLERWQALAIVAILNHPHGD